MTDPTPWVTVARLVRPQGRHGEVLADILTDFPERFVRMPRAFLVRKSAAPVAVAIENSWLHKGRIVLKFSGVDSISAAEELRGVDVVVPAAERVPLDSQSIYIQDLVGRELVDRTQPGGPVVGVIRDVIPQPESVDLLVVAARDGHEHWVPFARAYEPQMGTPGQVEMSLPAGLLDVNAPLSEEEIARQRSESAESIEE